MKAKAVLAIAMVMIAIGLSACGSTSQNTQAQQDGQDSFPRRQGQFNRSDLSGEVTSVNGNEVTIKVMEMPQMRPDTSWENRENGESRRIRDPEDGSRREERMRQQGDNPPRGQARENRFTGETKTLSVATGTTISAISFERGENGREAKSIELKDIKEGDILQIWYSDKEAQTIERITVMPSMGKPEAAPEN